jgi:putative salt-induced outer membrane protein
MKFQISFREGYAVVMAVALLTYGLSLRAEVQGLADESELGVVVLNGTSQSQSLNIKQNTSYAWDGNVGRFNYTYMHLTTDGNEAANNWVVGLRYERELTRKLSPFLGESIESDIFAGFNTRTNTDVGLRYKAIDEDKTKWSLEGGYRYAYEDRVAPPNTQYQLGRLHTDLINTWSPTVSTTLMLEYLPNFTQSDAYRVNGEAALLSALDKTFSVKIAYSAKYDNLPPRDISARYQTVFTTSAVAKF